MAEARFSSTRASGESRPQLILAQDWVHEKKGWKMEVGGAGLCAIWQSKSMLLFI